MARSARSSARASRDCRPTSGSMPAAPDRCAAMAISAPARSTRSNVPIGGRSSLEFGAELRYRITDTIGLVPFFDAGNVYRDQPARTSASLFYSAGLGVRYYTAIGPIRLDLAFPIEKRASDSAFQVYISIGPGILKDMAKDAWRSSLGGALAARARARRAGLRAAPDRARAKRGSPPQIGRALSDPGEHGDGERHQRAACRSIFASARSCIADAAGPRLTIADAPHRRFRRAGLLVGPARDRRIAARRIECRGQGSVAAGSDRLAGAAPSAAAGHADRGSRSTRSRSARRCSGTAMTLAASGERRYRAAAAPTPISRSTASTARRASSPLHLAFDGTPLALGMAPGQRAHRHRARRSARSATTGCRSQLITRRRRDRSTTGGRSVARGRNRRQPPTARSRSPATSRDRPTLAASGADREPSAAGRCGRLPPAACDIAGAVALGTQDISLERLDIASAAARGSGARTLFARKDGAHRRQRARRARRSRAARAALGRADRGARHGRARPRRHARAAERRRRRCDLDRVATAQGAHRLGARHVALAPRAIRARRRSRSTAAARSAASRRLGAAAGGARRRRSIGGIAGDPRSAQRETVTADTIEISDAGATLERHARRPIARRRHRRAAAHDLPTSRPSPAARCGRARRDARVSAAARRHRHRRAVRRDRRAAKRARRSSTRRSGRASHQAAPSTATPTARSRRARSRSTAPPRGSRARAGARPMARSRADFTAVAAAPRGARSAPRGRRAGDRQASRDRADALRGTVTIEAPTLAARACASMRCRRDSRSHGCAPLDARLEASCASTGSTPTSRPMRRRSGEALHVQAARGAAPAARGSTAQLDLAGGRIDGRLHGRVPDLGPFSDLAGMKLAGRAEFDARAAGQRYDADARRERARQRRRHGRSRRILRRRSPIRSRARRPCRGDCDGRHRRQAASRHGGEAHREERAAPGASRSTAQAHGKLGEPFTLAAGATLGDRARRRRAAPRQASTARLGGVAFRARRAARRVVARRRRGRSAASR